MSDTECPRCGSPMPAGGVCPVCEIPHDADDGARVASKTEAPAPTTLGRLWQSGRLAVLVSAVAFVLGTFVPSITVQRANHLGAAVAKSVLDLVQASEPYGRELKSTTLIAVPGAAVLLVSFLWSRRTRAAMVATRPLLFVIAMLPLAAVVLQMLRIEHHHRFEHSFGAGAVLIALGSIAGFVGAFQFGRGVPEAPSRRRDDDEGD